MTGTSYADDAKRLEEHFLAEWAGRTPVAEDNSDWPDGELGTTGDRDDEYVVLTIDRDDEDTASVESDPIYRHAGTFLVQVFTARGTGTQRALELAQAAAGILRDLQLDGIDFHRVRVARVGPAESRVAVAGVGREQDRYQMNVIGFYESDHRYGEP